jgi:predicted RNase H-like HicB family nuclease
MYRVGLPLWKTAARMGWTLQVRVEAMKDEEAGVFVARSPDLDGLVVEAKTLEELHVEVMHAADSLLELALRGQPARAHTDLHLGSSVFCAA